MLTPLVRIARGRFYIRTGKYIANLIARSLLAEEFPPIALASRISRIGRMLRSAGRLIPVQTIALWRQTTGRLNIGQSGCIALIKSWLTHAGRGLMFTRIGQNG